MVEKKLILAIFLVILQNVSSDLSEAENGLQRNVRRPSRGSYKYNHPPASEEYESIPVTVVQEKVQIRTGKAIESEIKQNRVEKVEVKSTTSSTTTTKSSTTNSKSTPELQKDVITTYRPPQARNKDQDKDLKSKTTSIREIPVAIIYEGKIEPEEKSLTKESKKSLVESSQEEKTQSSLTDIKKVNNNEKVPTSTTEDNVAIKKEESQNKAKDVSERSDSSQSKKKIRERDPVVPIVDMESYIYSHTGEFKYSYEGGDGTKAFETGELKTIDEEKTGESVSGGFSYKDKDGNDISLTYTADENGYRPVGAHLPTPPPIPPAIARALKYLATKTTPEPVTKPSKTSKESKEEDIKATTESVKASKS